MKKYSLLTILIALLTIALAAFGEENRAVLPIRGLHCGAPGKEDLPLCLKFIREALPKEGVTHLVIEFNYSYQFASHPELASPNALSKEDVSSIVEACREAKVKLIPQFNCLGHQSWAKNTFSLLTKYPEFDETPGKYPDNKDIYCRSYCPLHPKVHEVVFALIDELADVCQAEAFHVGMDEVFLLGDDDCPRCKSKNKAELFAGEVKILRDHLAESNRVLWMWGDRFLDGETTGVGEWEGSKNQTAPAIDLVPKDIVICDWHYEFAAPTAPYFALKGFNVVSSPWRKADVALGQLDLIRSVRQNANELVANRMQGVLHTTWCGMSSFVKAYYAEEASTRRNARETADCFKKLFAAIREGK
ncbi:MAG: family 20 glycosylhydrolase [Candidatus Omnitrophota bacterium]